MATPIYEFTQLPHVAKGDAGDAGDRRPLAQGEEPSVGVIYNPRSHGNQGADFDCGMSPKVHIAQPGDRSQLPKALSEFAATGIDLLVINGGDGTVRDVLTCGVTIFGEDWPAIAVLPKGKTNALTVDLGVPNDWTLQNAIDAFKNGSRVYRRPIEITTLSEAGDDKSGDDRSNRVLGFILGAGAFTTATQSGQGAHRLGAFNSMAVAVATGWALLRLFLSSRADPWRRGAKMSIKLGAQEVPMVHSGLGDPEWRQLLFASTLERMPAGAKPFGQLRSGLKLVATDQIKRRSIFTLIHLLRGGTAPNLRERGFHQLSTPQFTLEIDAPFILDGEAFPPGKYCIGQGPELAFVSP